MLLADFLRRGRAALRPLYPSSEADGLLAILCEDLLGVKSYTHIVEPGYVIPAALQGEAEDALERLSGGEPIQYILGKTDFCGRTFQVTPSVLIPRPETEQLCALALEWLQGRRDVSVLDLCTGSGNIAWTLAFAPEVVRTVGVDKSEAALTVAQAQPLGDDLALAGGHRPEFLCCDLLSDPPREWPAASFDLILSNPPYVLESEKPEMRTNVLDHEPAEALFVPDSTPLLFYEAVARWVGRLLAPGGRVMVEINEKAGLSARRLFETSGFSDVLTIKDFYGKDRFVSALKI